MRLSAIIIALLLALSPALALIDLVGPVDGTATSNQTVNFDYYVSMQGLQSCKLNLQGQQFQDPDAASNAMNTVQMQNLAPGTYSWNISCSNGAEEYSSTRTLIIDTQAPIVTLLSPQQGTYKNIALDFIPYDETASMLQCAVKWNNDTLESQPVSRDTHYTKNYSGTPGNGTLTVTCADLAGNTASAVRNFTIIPDFGLQLSLDKQQYGLAEAPKLTINTVPGANVTVDICPDQAGFVQCTSALIDTNAFPQTVTLPIMNKTGRYLVDGMASYGGQTKFNTTGYNVTNTMQLEITRSGAPRLNRSINLSAVASGGIVPYRFLWKLSNGTTSTASLITVAHPASGNYSHNVTVYDQANNTRSVMINYTVDPVYSIIFQVTDEQTGEAIVDAELDITNQETNEEQHPRTVQGGYAYADLEAGGNRVFISAPNYEYFLEEYEINSSMTIPIRLKRSMLNAPQVSITSPAQQASLQSPVVISYVTTGQSPSCTLLFADSGSWFKPNGTQQGNGSFTKDLPPGAYQVKVECTDSRGRSGTSSLASFTVVATPQAQQAAATLQGEQQLQDEIERLDALLVSMDSYGQKEKEAIALLGFDRQLRNAKKSLQQAVRDVNDLQFRQDLSDEEKKNERERIITGAQQTAAATPIGLRVADAKSYVKYIREEDLPEVAAELSGLGGIAAKQSALERYLLDDQQKFTVSSRLMQVEQVYADESTKTSTIVTRTLTYAEGLAPEYQVYEIIPKEVAKSSKELTLITKAEVLKDDPVLRFGQEQTITYIIPKKVDFTRLEDTKTVLARPYVEGNLITGFAILGGKGTMDSPIILIIGFVILAYLAYYFDIVKQVKYIIYRMGKKEKVHYVSVLINDAVSQLDASNYEKAEMLYKEIRLSYDALPMLAKNELYEDIVDLVHRMDAYYFNTVMIELDSQLKTGDMQSAISSYEKLTHIYERLDAERQQQLVQAVAAMGRRLGLEAAA